MNPIQRITEMLADAEDLNEEVKEFMNTMTLNEARTLYSKAGELAGWAQGIRKLLHLSAGSE